MKQLELFADPRIKERACKACGIVVGKGKSFCRPCFSMRRKALRKRYAFAKGTCSACSGSCDRKAARCNPCQRIAKVESKCKSCKRAFIGVVHQRFCTPVCKNKYDCIQKAARRRATFIEDVSLGDVFDKCGGICALCNQPVDVKLRQPRRLKASIDHIVPTSKGGDHSLANTQLAHIGCNSKKCNRTDAEGEGASHL